MDDGVVCFIFSCVIVVGFTIGFYTLILFYYLLCKGFSALVNFYNNGFFYVLFLVYKLFLFIS